MYGNRHTATVSFCNPEAKTDFQSPAVCPLNIFSNRKSNLKHAFRHSRFLIRNFLRVASAIRRARGIFRGGLRLAPNHQPDINGRRENNNRHDNNLNIHNSFKFRIPNFKSKKAASNREFEIPNYLTEA
jgi:hypothetical protein